MTASGMASRKESEMQEQNSKRMESQVSDDIPDRSMTPYKESDSERSQRNQYVKTEDIVHELDES